MTKMSCFINEKMKVLIVINENQLIIDGVEVCPLNQQEIANLVPCSKLKVNQILKELTEEGYVTTLRVKGRYILMDKAIELIERLS